ncbi:MAG: N-acetylmuramoyl-L-alanine amidase [Anaerophaga sp.]|nr:N-acetylmuramoyl-L-alanine amidase [Anaerophaga sp.]
MITIKKHILNTDDNVIPVSFDASPNHSDAFSEGLPDTIVIHYTAGSSLDSSVNWLKNPASKASTHVIIGKKGEIVQLVPFNIKAWHAGISEWRGRSGLNRYSIGIEIDNAGLLEKRADGYYSNFGKRVDNSQVVLAPHKYGDKEQAWEAFTEKQIEVVETLCLLLKENYPIKEIVGHEDVSRGRKTDPGPAFPLQKIINRVLTGRKDDESSKPDDNVKYHAINYGVVSADYLNIRKEPSTNGRLASDPLPRGTKLKIIEEKNGWLRVKVELQGWVSQKWVKGV